MPVNRDPKTLQRFESLTKAILTRCKEKEHPLTRKVTQLIEQKADPVKADTMELQDIIHDEYVAELLKQNSGEVVEWLARIITDIAIDTCVRPQIGIGRMLNRLAPDKEGDEWKDAE